MAKRLLFLAHRIPWPPDKGEKIRARHILDYLSRHFEVDLGCLVDDRDDLRHIPVLRERLAHVEAPFIAGGGPGAALRTLRYLRPGAPLSRGWFHHPALAAWVRGGLASGRYDAVFVFSSAMAPYVLDQPRNPTGQRRVLDLVDVDSAKFAAYAKTAKGPMRLVYAREARTLLALERRAAAAFDQALLVSEPEARHFLNIAPECADRVSWIENGVDCARFDPDRSWPTPFEAPGPHLVFTGAMNYRPNIEAVEWFARDILPMLRERAAPPSFHIVGMRPAPAVMELAGLPGVHVTGTVPEVQPWLAHADAVVAPLRIARGIQNKVLEAMAMARPVVATPAAFEGIHAMPGRDLLLASNAAEFATRVASILDGEHPQLGGSGRIAVLAGHAWDATLGRLGNLLGVPA